MSDSEIQLRIFSFLCHETVLVFLTKIIGSKTMSRRRLWSLAAPICNCRGEKSGKTRLRRAHTSASPGDASLSMNFEFKHRSEVLRSGGYFEARALFETIPSNKLWAKNSSSAETRKVLAVAPCRNMAVAVYRAACIEGRELSSSL